MKVLKICIGTWANATHDKRELSVCRELGAEVLVAAKGDSTGQQEMVDGFPVVRLSSRPWGRKVPVSVNRLVSLFSWASYIRKMKDVDVISGHDLTGLFIGWLSNFFKRKKAKLVYDSHEFELGRDSSSGQSRFAHWFVCRLERFLMKRCVFSIMVNDSIADEVQRIHKLKDRPVVARNTSVYWELNDKNTAQTRKELLKQLGADEDSFIVMYHGFVTRNRGIEQMLQAIAKVPDVRGIVLGNGDNATYVDSLHKLADSLGIADRVLFHAAVPIDILRNYVSAVDVGVVTVLATSKSYYYMLPNKFFECIQSLTPVIVSDFPETGSITDQYGIGLKVDPAQVDQIAEAIVKMRDDKALYGKCKENLRIAKEALCWEKEKEKLKDAYRQLLVQ